MNKAKVILVIQILFLISILAEVTASSVTSKTSFVTFVSSFQINITFPVRPLIIIPFYFPPNSTSQYNDIAWRVAHDDWIEIEYFLNGDGDNEITLITSW